MGMSMVMRRLGIGWGFRSVGVGQGCGKGEAGFIVNLIGQFRESVCSGFCSFSPKLVGQWDSDFK